MKFLLTAINAKYIHSNPAIYSLRSYAGSRLRKHIELAEFTINMSMQVILGEIYRKKPDVIGISCYIWNWNLVRDLLNELPKILPNTDIWLGGPEVSYDGEAILRKFPRVAGIMVGEGEATFKELLEIYVEEGTKESFQARLQNCSGLYLPTGYTMPRALMDISAIPFLYEDLAPFSNRIIYYETSRGCPCRCSYCLSSIDKKVRFRDINVVKRELQLFLDNRVKQVKFVDRTFNCNHEHAMAIWRYLLEHDNHVTNFHFEISADILREEEILLLNQMRPGLVQLEIGVQSTNPETISAIQRAMNVDKLEHIVEAIYRVGNIHQHLDLIAGLPFEGYGSFGRSFDRVYGMKPQQLQLGFLKILKGSPMAQKVKEYGIQYLDRPPYEVLSTKWLSYNEVLLLKQIEEVVEVYYNSGQYAHTLPFLERAFGSPFAMFEAMADFFEHKDASRSVASVVSDRGYFLSSPARVHRYEILLKFAEKYDKKNLPVYRELLSYDLYLRENAKSRPGFAVDLKAYKEEIHTFYRKEEQTRAYLPDYKAYDRKQMEKMTHLEPFIYPVWDLDELVRTVGADGCKNMEAGWYILFDYQKRNPLNYDADTQIISAGSIKTKGLSAP